MTKDEALDLALEALEGIHPGNMTPMAEEYWNKAITAIKQARSAPVQEPVAWVDLLKAAEQIVKEKFLYKRFIDGTPLANDIPCWMATFAQEHATPPAAQPVFKPCSCRWNGETQVQQCTLHAAHIEAIHEWAERAKTAESKLKGRTNEQET
jgi:hypothetical protein